VSEKAEEKKAEQAVDELRKAAEHEAKAKRPRAVKKKEGEAPTPAAPQAPGALGEEKKVVRKRKKKEPTEQKPAGEAIQPAQVQAITAQEAAAPLAEAPKPEEKKPEQKDEKTEG
jgi:hypothetical protein